MTLGLLDLSIVTDELIKRLTAYRNASALWDENQVTSEASKIGITGLAPEVARKKTGCNLSVFLFHVGLDQFSRNTYPGGGGSKRGQPNAIPAQRTPLQPLALSLHFLVTAFSDDEESAWVYEQQAMSIALKFFHEHPRIIAQVPIGRNQPLDRREQVLAITFEPQTIDEIGRVWQAISKPLRLSAVYRAAVVLLEPPSQPPPPKGQVREIHVEAVPRLIGSTITANKDGVASVVVDGAGFDATTTTVLLHSSYTQPPSDISLTLDNAAAPAAGKFVVVGPNRLDLKIPAGTKPHGYQLLIRPVPGKPTLAFWLIVPELPP